MSERPLRICTFLTRSYLPGFLAMRASLRRFHPEAVCTIMCGQDDRSLARTLARRFPDVSVVDADLDALPLPAQDQALAYFLRTYPKLLLLGLTRADDTVVLLDADIVLLKPLPKQLLTAPGRIALAVDLDHEHACVFRTGAGLPMFNSGMVICAGVAIKREAILDRYRRHLERWRYGDQEVLSEHLWAEHQMQLTIVDAYHNFTRADLVRARRNQPWWRFDRVIALHAIGPKPWHPHTSHFSELPMTRAWLASLHACGLRWPPLDAARPRTLLRLLNLSFRFRSRLHEDCPGLLPLVQAGFRPLRRVLVSVLFPRR